MKKETKSGNHNIIVGGLAALCLIILAGAYFLTRDPKGDFVPAATQADTSAATWDEKNTHAEKSTISKAEPLQTEGSTADNTQTLVTEDENGSVNSLSKKNVSSSTKKPSEPPTASGDLTNPEKAPEYSTSVPQTEAASSPQKSEADSHPGQIYVPNFGWLDAGDTVQDKVDSTGDINKQVGTMGGN